MCILLLTIVSLLDDTEVAERYRAQDAGLEPVLDITPLLEYARRPGAMLARDLVRPVEDEPLESARVISFLRRLRRRFLHLFLHCDATQEHLEALREEESAFTNLPFGQYSADGLPRFELNEPEYMN